MKKKFIFAFSIAATLISGCSAISEGKIENNVKFNGNGTRDFTFEKAEGVNESEIKHALASSFYKASLIHTVRHSDNDTLKGVKVALVGNDIAVTHYGNYGSLYDEKSAVFNIAITENENDYKVTVKCPSEYLDRANSRGTIGQPEYTSRRDVVNNLNAMCTKSTPSIANN
ncbi:hypothetical protein [Photobacterium minamisatsumaniensis]|uniref:hypothetical protein n=1 Tax=Photobacterium minamisatsumaniensis TaxID=2910233 RepID=UPI003D0FCD13